MPTAKPSPTNADDGSGRHTRKSTRLKKSKTTYDPSVEAEKRMPNTSTVAVPTHSLMTEPDAVSANERTAFDETSPDETLESSESRSVDVEVQPTEENSSDSFSNKVLYQKWVTAILRASETKSTLASVRKELKDVEKEKRLIVRKLEVYKNCKTKADKLSYELTVTNTEKSALEEEVTFLNSEKRRIATAHKNETTHMKNECKFKIETANLTAQRILNDEKLKVKEQGLTITALKEKIERMEEVLSSQAKKCANYDELTAHAVKANIAMQVCKDKAQVR